MYDTAKTLKRELYCVHANIYTTPKIQMAGPTETIAMIHVTTNKSTS